MGTLVVLSSKNNLLNVLGELSHERQKVQVDIVFDFSGREVIAALRPDLHRQSNKRGAIRGLTKSFLQRWIFDHELVKLSDLL